MTATKAAPIRRIVPFRLSNSPRWPARCAWACVTSCTGVLSVPGTYLLADRGQQQVYVGETGNLARRLQEHAIDPSKAWASEAFILCGLDRRLDKAAVVHLQKRLSDTVTKAATARLVAGVGACNADLPLWRRMSPEAMFAGALAGLREP